MEVNNGNGCGINSSENEKTAGASGRFWHRRYADRSPYREQG
jgi:hypothetical protein